MKIEILVSDLYAEYGIKIVHIRGSLDTKTVNYFQRRLALVVETGLHALILDCRELKYVNSTGWGYLEPLTK